MRSRRGWVSAVLVGAGLTLAACSSTTATPGDNMKKNHDTTTKPGSSMMHDTTTKPGSSMMHDTTTKPGSSMMHDTTTTPGG